MIKQLTVWGRLFDLEVVYDVYEGENILPEQEEAFAAFLQAGSAVDAALAEVKAYCLRLDGEKIPEGRIDNIFRYVVPRAIYVCRKKQEHVVALICHYRFDPEHGMAVVFENETFKEIGAEFIVM